MANLGQFVVDSGMTGIHENGSFISFGRELPHNFYNFVAILFSIFLLVLEVDNKSYVDVQHWLCTFWPILSQIYQILQKY